MDHKKRVILGHQRAISKLTVENTELKNMVQYYSNVSLETATSTYKFVMRGVERLKTQDNET